jgi:hypothetical protein
MYLLTYSCFPRHFVMNTAKSILRSPLMCARTGFFAFRTRSNPSWSRSSKSSTKGCKPRPRGGCWRFLPVTEVPQQVMGIRLDDLLDSGYRLVCDSHRLAAVLALIFG